MEKWKSVDEYLASLSEESKEALAELRRFILNIDPRIKEYIGYNMPAYKDKKALFYFYEQKNHYGLYPTAKPMETFKEELKKYKTSKGSIQIPKDIDMPYELIRKIIKYNLDNQ